MTNPLLAAWTTPFGLPPFDQISDEDYAPAVDEALAQSRANIAAIAENADEPDFENTIVALEQADELLSRVLGAFYNVAGADSNLLGNAPSGPHRCRLRVAAGAGTRRAAGRGARRARPPRATGPGSPRPR